MKQLGIRHDVLKSLEPVLVLKRNSLATMLTVLKSIQ